MYNLFGEVRKYLKLDDVSIDNTVFRLHYKVTMILLLIFSLMVSSSQFFGHPIQCESELKRALQVVETYCWITSTFTIPSLAGKVGRDIIAPGVGSFIEGKDEVKHHKYYQWVCFCLFFQAMLFYVPRYLWKIWEGGRMKKLAENLKFVPVRTSSVKEMCCRRSEYFRKHLNRHTFYFCKFIICEVLNFVNVVGQVFLIDAFLGGEFVTYGLEVVNFPDKSYEDRVDPMSRIFPKVTKCSFHTYGPSGSIQLHDSLCVLSLNILNEKIYIFLWFWLLFLAIVSGLILIYRISTICFSAIRRRLLKFRFRNVSESDLDALMDLLSISDWFVFYKLSQNVDPVFCKDVVRDLVITSKQ